MYLAYNNRTKWIERQVKNRAVLHPLGPTVEVVAGTVVGGPSWCCGVVVMQSAYEKTILAQALVCY